VMFFVNILFSCDHLSSLAVVTNIQVIIQMLVVMTVSYWVTVTLENLTKISRIQKNVKELRKVIKRNKVSSVAGCDVSWPAMVPSVVPSLRYSSFEKATQTLKMAEPYFRLQI